MYIIILVYYVYAYAYMDGKDFTWLITLREHLILLPTPSHNPHTDRHGGHGGCVNRNLKRTPSTDHTTHLHGINIITVIRL